RARLLVMTVKPSRWMLLASVAAAVLLPLPVAMAQSDAQWRVFTNTDGTMVQYPADVFPSDRVAESADGSVFTTCDDRAQLQIFTVRNERNESPAQYLTRVFPTDRRLLDYDRVASNFFAVSENREDRILYRRCNFVDRLIHCIDLNYPRREKLAWDGIVTRISLSLRPR